MTRRLAESGGENDPSRRGLDRVEEGVGRNGEWRGGVRRERMGALN